MKPKLLATLCLLAGLTSLSGCLAINAALGLFSFIGPPAAQLAGAAYTVTEYSYEYAANDRTPDQVMLAKIDWLIGADEESVPARKPFREVALASPRTHVPALLQSDRPDLEPLFELASHPVMAAGFTVVAEETETAAVETPVRVRAVAQPTGLEEAVVVVAAEPEIPVRAYVYRLADPLMNRMNRMESGLPQAEAMLLSQGDGLRLSMPCPDGEPCSLGVSGSWSIRHPVMAPAPVQSTGSGTHPLNT